MGELDRKIDVMHTEIKRLAIKRDIGNALAACGVKQTIFKRPKCCWPTTSISR
jgi:hypothetical protein